MNDLARFQLMNELLLLLTLIRLERIVKIRLIVDLGPCYQANLETHRSHDLYMSQNIISSEVNKGVCQAFECIAEATHTIEIKVGQQGTISLLLCKESVTDSQIREVLMHK